MLLIARDPSAHLPQASEFRDSYLSRNSPNVEPPRADVFSGPTTSSDRHAAEQCDELASFQLVELHSMPANQAGLQDIELATISQRVSERFHNHPTVEEPVRCPGWVLAVRKLQRPPRT
jgi:hypothetical protein